MSPKRTKPAAPAPEEEGEEDLDLAGDDEEEGDGDLGEEAPDEEDDDLGDDLFGDSQAEDAAALLQEQVLEDFPDYEEEEEVEPYKHLRLRLHSKRGTHYKIAVMHQSHGFLNLLVGKLLAIEGVDFAAYKLTTINDPIVSVRLDPDRNLRIQDVLNEAADRVLKEVDEFGKALSATDI
jgi:DNA-directed RNA polymerase subunit L